MHHRKKSERVACGCRGGPAGTRLTISSLCRTCCDTHPSTPLRAPIPQEGGGGEGGGDDGDVDEVEEYEIRAHSLARSFMRRLLGGGFVGRGPGPAAHPPPQPPPPPPLPQARSPRPLGADHEGRP